jgi:hypothetical protein
MMLRRAAVIAAGLAMTASAALAGAGTASAAAPAGIKDGSMWTIEINHGGCGIATFHAGIHIFTSDNGDFGNWSVPAPNKVKMTWTGGPIGLVFKGTYTTTPNKEYLGKFNNIGGGGQLVKGIVSN